MAQPHPPQPRAVLAQGVVGTKARGEGSEGSQPYLRWGLVHTSMFANFSWSPPRLCSFSSGDLKLFWCTRVPLSPLLPIPPSLPVLRYFPGPRGWWQEGCAVPGAVAVLWGASGAELPAGSLWLPVAVVVGRGSPFRDSCYWICCREAKPGRLGYKHLGNKDL